MVDDTTQLAPLPKNLVVFDGVCGLCDASVQRLLSWDKDEVLTFTPYQGDTFAAIHERHPHLVPDASIIFVTQEGSEEAVYTHSMAIFQLLRRLKAPYSWLSLFRFIPSFISDAVYGLVSKNRLKIWGQLDSCRMPTPSERARFLA